MIGRNVKRETVAWVRDGGKDRHVVVEIMPRAGAVSVRLKGTRRAYYVPADQLYLHALKLAVRAEKQERARERAKANGNGKARARTVKRGIL